MNRFIVSGVEYRQDDFLGVIGLRHVTITLLSNGVIDPDELAPLMTGRHVSIVPADE